MQLLIAENVGSSDYNQLECNLIIFETEKLLIIWGKAEKY